MIDIAKCNDKECKSREYCYRYMSIAKKDNQLYGYFNEYRGNEDKCSWFWNINMEVKE